MNQSMLSVSPVYAGNAEFIEDLYERYLAQPTSVPEEWQNLFSTFKGVDSPMRTAIADQLRRLFDDQPRDASASRNGAAERASVAKQIAPLPITCAISCALAPP